MSKVIDDYLAHLSAFMAQAAGPGRATLEAAAEACVQAVLADRTIWLFGAGHGQCLALELHHRAGTSACFVPMASPALAFAEGAAVETALERLPAMAPAMVARHAWQPGDVLIAISSSGTTPLTVEVARLAGERGLTVLALGSPACAASRPERPSLFALADHVLDNGAPEGDAVVELAQDLRVGAFSSVSGALLLQLLAGRVAERLLEQDFAPPVWRASALPGSDAHNDRLAAVWQERNRSL
ncbi:sugar isomerase domain-containing protein [Geminicoccus roseus]|uniref:sugar isomerase domain-containing protein n=1 Tax=Geminicoccus roseus TaxID=404900 RepID=UPI0003FB7F16|nr:sugar isomerase domain-containing protein [Geminicoccus roseus]